MSSILKTLLSAFSENGPGRVVIAATANGAALEEEKLLQFVIPSWGDPNNVLVLPSPMPGKVVIAAGSEVGGELRSSDPGVVVINGEASFAGVAVDPNEMIIAICESVFSWKVFGIADDGTVFGSGPMPPTGFVFLVDEDGAYLLDDDGAYLLEAV
jgi:hypothetical protein